MTAPVNWFGPEPDGRVLEQAKNAAAHPNVVGVSLMADGDTYDPFKD